MNNKKIKLIAISVAMVLSTQMVLAEDVITDFGGLTDALKNATGSSATVKLGSDISATASIQTGGVILQNLLQFWVRVRNIQVIFLHLLSNLIQHLH